MAADQIWCEAFLFQLGSGIGTSFAPDGFGLEVCDQGMNPRLIAAANAVSEVLHALRQLFIRFLDAQPDDLMASLVRESSQNVDVLAGEALVYEQQLHNKYLKHV